MSVKLFAYTVGKRRRLVPQHGVKMGQHLTLKRSEACTIFTNPMSKTWTFSYFSLWIYLAYLNFSSISTVSLRTMRFHLPEMICSQPGFMSGTVKQRTPFQVPQGRARVIMEAILALNMRSLESSILRCGSILKGPLQLKVSISTTTPMKRFGLLFSRLPTHLILYVMYMLQTAGRSCRRSACIRCSRPVA